MITVGVLVALLGIIVAVVGAVIGEKFMKILKKIFCKHDFIYIRNLYGDKINLHNGKRNEYRCKKCGMYKWM